MVKIEYKITHNGVTKKFKNICDAWDFCDANGLPRCKWITDSSNVHPYRKGPKYWEANLMFWHSTESGKIRYSEQAKAYYNGWLQDMFDKERIETKLQDKLQ